MPNTGSSVSATKGWPDSRSRAISGFQRARLLTNPWTSTTVRAFTGVVAARVLPAEINEAAVATENSRLFIIAREHYLEVKNRKRTSLYEIAYDSETGPFSFTMHGEFPSAGDTAYACVVPISGSKFLVSYYSSNLKEDPPWARAILGPTDIWQATIDLANL